MSRRHAPRATTPVPEGVHVCPCGQPAPDTHICATCAERVRDNLLTIAERWPELENALQWRETPNAGPIPPQPGDIDPDEGVGNVTGLTVNEQVIHAMRKSASIVRYCTLTLRDEADRVGTPHTPPRTDGSLDDTPKLARWVALANAYTLTTAPPENVVHAIAGDLITAETATYRALNPRGIHWAPVNLACDDHDTSDLGERIPCPGRMWAKVGTEVMPDLVCDHNPEHTVEPGTWERQGWRRRLRQPLHPSGMARLAQRLAR